MAMAVALKELKADERQERGARLKSVEELQRQEAQLRAEVASLEASTAYLAGEFERVAAAADGLERQADERREMLGSHDGLVALLRDAGEDRVEAALVEIGWVEPEEPGDAP
jgi:hypothetical protein